MPPRQFALPSIDRRGDGFASFLLSLTLHGGIIAVLIYGAYLFHAPPQEEVLPIEAELSRVTVAPKVKPEPQPVETPAPPPQPSPEDLAKEQAAKEQAAQEEAQKEQQAAEEERQRKEAKAAQEKAQAEELVRQKEAERVAQEKAAAEKAAKEKAAAEAKRQADLKKQLEQEEQARKAAAERAQREAELKRSLAQEEQADSAAKQQADELRASWQSAISARIHRAWNVPPVVPTDLRCELHVTQEPGGKVTNVTLGACNADAAVKESIQAAAYRASPLPEPPDPSIFDRNLFLIFKP